MAEVEPEKIGAIKLPEEGQANPLDPKPKGGETPEGGETTPEGGGEGNQEEKTPIEGGEGGEGDGKPVATIKVGDKVYTADQVEKLAKDSNSYIELLPEFTRKSQDLAKLKGPGGEQPKAEDTPFFLKEGWQPQDYGELQRALKLAMELGESKAVTKFESMLAKQGEAKEAVDNFVTEVKKTNPGFNEDDFYAYVKRHEIPIKDVANLKSAYSQYTEVIGAKAKGAKTAKEKITLRKTDTVGQPQTGKGSGFKVSMETLRKSGTVFGAAADAIQKLKNK
jgi:hypothetical protein|tara:strand:+ start:286 stop:1122 length:837 start_codon:yes stop_codon:yes gene_type:complete